jgi:hypothetical protein
MYFGAENGVFFLQDNILYSSNFDVPFQFVSSPMFKPISRNIVHPAALTPGGKEEFPPLLWRAGGWRA